MKYQIYIMKGAGLDHNGFKRVTLERADGRIVVASVNRLRQIKQRHIIREEKRETASN